MSFIILCILLILGSIKNFIISLNEVMEKEKINNYYFWLDIICINQNSKNIIEDLKNLEPIYCKCVNHFVIGYKTLNRGWCM